LEIKLRKGSAEAMVNPVSLHQQQIDQMVREVPGLPAKASSANGVSITNGKHLLFSSNNSCCDAAKRNSRCSKPRKMWQI
jgi:hypothetical protein